MFVLSSLDLILLLSFLLLLLARLIGTCWNLVGGETKKKIIDDLVVH